MLTVPQAFLQNDAITKVMVDGQNCLIDKVATQVNADNERYVAQPALTVVRSGKLRISGEEGMGLVVEPGQMVLLPVGVYFISDMIPADEPFRALVFFFKEDLLAEFLAEFPTPSQVRAPQVALFGFPESLQTFTQSLIDLYGPYTQGKVTRYKLLELLHLAHGALPGRAFLESLQASQYRKRQSITALMEQHYDKPFSVEDYAHLTGRSLSTFHRDFKRQFGEAPKRWLVHRRMDKAKGLLSQDAQLSIQEVVFQFGYDNVSHFIKVFQDRFGQSPKQWQIASRQERNV
ncbi:MAG: AraC family transcriptional regulator [Bacteroidota bacterium]